MLGSKAGTAGPLEKTPRIYGGVTRVGLLHAMLQTVLPVFLIGGSALVFRRLLGIDPKPIARTAVYLFVPALAFDGIYKTQLPGGEVGKIIAFMGLITVCMISLTWLAGLLLGWEKSDISAATLGTSFYNTANYGLPVVYFAWGPEAVGPATLVVVCNSVLMYTVGVFIAAHGRADWRRALMAIFELPLVWAVLAALLVRWSGLVIPEPAYKAIALLGSATVPVVLVLLGMQMATMSIQGARAKVGVAALLRLVVSPVVGLLLVWLLRPVGLTAKILVLQAAMPTAVNTLIAAVEYDAKPDFVSGIVLASTLFSIATVSFWVWYLL